MSDDKKRTITLTGRPPVTINEDAWPLIASARDHEHDGQVECQANRQSKWFIGVRQHDDGRAIIYATYSYTSNWQGARCFYAKRGRITPASDLAQLCREIENVAHEMESCEVQGEDAERWNTLAAECIAELPAEELS